MEDLDVLFYVETASGMIYEAQLLPDYVLLRPATPALYSEIRRLNYVEFTRDFEDFCGNREDVIRHLYTGESLEFQQETRH